MTVKPLTQLLETEMDRKEFILYMGLILLTLTGITGALKNISTLARPKSQKGFGGGPYGK